MGDVNITDILGISGITQLLPMLYTDLAQPSVKKMGQALETTVEFATIPMLLLKLANEKVKINFQHNIEMYREKLNGISDEKIERVNPQIGVPILENLTTVTDEEIADLFTTLLQKASNRDTLNQAHPSFVQMIARLSVDEARLIKHLRNKPLIPTVGIKGFKGIRANGVVYGSEPFTIIAEKLTLLPFEVDLFFPDNIDAYLDNFVSMGILGVDPFAYTDFYSEYQTIIEKYQFDKIEEDEQFKEHFSRHETERAGLHITEYGNLFISACNLQDIPKEAKQ
ncbi:MAG: hypothetical protein Ta2B_17660 [Termitinemataceae bacterium]|nr:MAG: hypothetical protein Ta2B_17660 [Termitinemataceae bacterium]